MQSARANIGTTGECSCLFKSIHMVMKAEDILVRKGIECDLVPVPREIASDCGMALVIDCAIADDVRKALSAQKVEMVALYVKTETGFSPVFDRR